MKKFLIGSVMLFVFAVALPIVTSAQKCYPCQPSNASRNHYKSNNYNARSRNNRRPSFFQRHRNTRNIILSTGGGALIGGLLGGNRKGMLKGAIVGAAAGALYTYVLKPKKRNY